MATATIDTNARRRARAADRRDGLVSLATVHLSIEPLAEIIERIGGVGEAFDRYDADRRAKLRRSFYRGVEEGQVTAAAADELACALDRNPFEVWGQAWWDVA